MISDQPSPQHNFCLPFNDQCSHHVETSQLICSANQLTGFYMRGTLVVKRLMYSYENLKGLMTKILLTNMLFATALKVSVFGVILVHIFPHSEYGLNTERHGVSLSIQSKCGKMRTRITSNTDTFHSVCLYLRFYGTTLLSLPSFTNLGFFYYAKNSCFLEKILYKYCNEP